jgi:uncharacterized protein YmfQ (DUF2313 family)
VALSAAAYVRQLLALLPPGAAWRREPGTLVQLLTGLADELGRVDGRGAALIDESDPRTTFETLSDWERVYGLPDPCVGGSPSTPQRRASLVAKIVGLGGQSPAYFIAVAAALGYTVTITEFSPADVNDDVDQPIEGDAWAYAWQVNAPLHSVFEMTVEDGVDDPLAAWSALPLECTLAALAPAHTIPIFTYA